MKLCLKNNAPLLAAAAFTIPAALMLIILGSMGFYPFGDKSLLIMDMHDQYVQFFEHLKHITAGEGSIFFSWAKSYGTNFTGLFAYYLSSPLSILTLLFEDIQAGIFVLTVLKIALCGVSSFFYFYCHLRCKGPAVLLFTTSYAMMSYNMVYSLSLMWLDAVIMLPVILLGAERVLAGGRGLLFILSLAVLLMSNYYTGYMVCLFSALYIVYRHFSQPSEKHAMSIAQVLRRFGACYILALGLSAWLLLPAFLDLTAGKIGYTGYVPGEIFNFPLLSYAHSFLPGRYTSIATNGVPALYTGILTAFMCLFFFFSSRVSIREKLWTAGLFVLLLCSFLFTRLDVVWHLFKYPNWFPYRYAFVFQFLVVAIACRSWQASAGDRVLFGNVIPALLLGFMCFDLSMNAGAMFKGLDNQFGYKPVTQYTQFTERVKPVIDGIHEQDSGFYRIEKTFKHTMNDALGLGYRGITHYSSMFSRELLTVTKKLGMAQTHFWNGYIGSTPVTDALLGVKYILSEVPLPYGTVWEQGGVAVYGNPYHIPVAFTWAPGSGLHAGSLLSRAVEAAGGYDCFAVQNTILRELGGSDVFIPVDNVDKSGTGYTFISNGRPVYAYFPVSGYEYHPLLVNGDMLMPWYTSPDDNNAVYTGTFPEGGSITITLGTGEEIQTLQGEYIYTLDTEALAEIAGRLAAGGLRDIDYTARRLSGRIYAENDGYMFISVPYDAGWTVRIDSSKVSTERALGAFMAVPVTAGEHTVEMSFRPQGLTAGFIISSLSVLACMPFLQRGCEFKVVVLNRKQIVI